MTSFFVGCFAFGLPFTVMTFLLGGLGGTKSYGVAHGLLSGLTGSTCRSELWNDGEE